MPFRGWITIPVRLPLRHSSVRAALEGRGGRGRIQTDILGFACGASSDGRRGTLGRTRTDMIRLKAGAPDLWSTRAWRAGARPAAGREGIEPSLRDLETWPVTMTLRPSRGGVTCGNRTHLRCFTGSPRPGRVTSRGAARRPEESRKGVKPFRHGFADRTPLGGSARCR